MDKALRSLLFLFTLFFLSSLNAHLPGRILVTACNEPYFDTCLTLISSIHHTSLASVDRIYVYNLGLTAAHITALNSLYKVEVRDFETLQGQYPNMDPDFFYKKPHCCAWKQVSLNDASDQDGDLILWLDAGVLLLKSAQEIFDLIARDDIFLVRDNWHNYTWTHPKCALIMKATEKELRDYQLCAGIQGYKKGGAYQKMMDEALKYSLIRECIDGHLSCHYGQLIPGEEILGHRHAQSILSILASRYHCPTHSIYRYGEWRTLEQCQKQDSVIWVHRRQHHDHSHLKWR